MTARVDVTDDVASFDRAVSAFLAADPVGNTILLTVMDVLRAGGSHGDDPPWFAWVSDATGVIGAALRTPPCLVALTAMTGAAADALGAAIRDRELPGAVGPAATAAALARGAGRRHCVRMREVQYVLTELRPPHPVDGQPRPFAPDDSALFAAWFDAFDTEAGLAVRGDALEALNNRLSTGGGAWFWCVDGEPVCMAGRSGPVHGVPRIGPVWTPPEHRRRGYAAALTAHICAEALAISARAVTLYADAANATANGVYTRIGFRPVAEIVEAVFEIA